jgi:hypothetical protein
VLKVNGHPLCQAAAVIHDQNQEADNVSYIRQWNTVAVGNDVRIICYSSWARLVSVWDKNEDARGKMRRVVKTSK